MRVWIEQDYCTGDGLCEELCSDVFQMHDDGLAHVREELGHIAGSPGSEVPRDFDAAVLEAQAQCAGECIYTAALRRPQSSPRGSALERAAYTAASVRREKPIFDRRFET